MKQYLECGQVVSTHGTGGVLRVKPWSDSPQTLLDKATLYGDVSGKTVYQVESARIHSGVVLLKVRGINTLTEAERLRGQVLYLDRNDEVLEEGEYFLQDLLGCEAVDVDTGKSYGKLYDSRDTGANYVYYLRDEQGVERLVPVLDHVVLHRDLENRRILIRPLPGLFADEE